MKKQIAEIVLKKLTKKDHEELFDCVEDPSWYMIFEGWIDPVTKKPSKEFVVERHQLYALYREIGKVLKENPRHRQHALRCLLAPRAGALRGKRGCCGVRRMGEQ